MMQEDFGLISIIMAAYNTEKTIEQAINSVLSQTYTNFELLVVNDAQQTERRSWSKVLRPRIVVSVLSLM